MKKPVDESALMKALGVAEPRQLDQTREPVNTGGYILDNDALTQIAKAENWIMRGRKKSSGLFDMAGSLIEGLVKRGFPVYRIPIDAWGDFGQLSFFLDTFPKALSGEYPIINTILENRGHYHDVSNNVWVHPESLKTRDKQGRTLRQRMEQGNVTIGPNVFIGRGVVIGDGVVIRYSDVEKYNTIGGNAQLDHVYMSSYGQVGPHAELQECAFGLDCHIESSSKAPTHINGRSVLGPKIRVPRGTRLDRAIVFPGYRFEAENEIHSHAELIPTIEQVLPSVIRYKKD